MILQLPKTQKGFTLIESIVATALFVIVVTAIMSVYNSVLDLNRRTDAIRAASQDARYYSEFLSKELRNMQGFDYSGKFVTNNDCPSVTSQGAPDEGGTTSLAIININGDYECFAGNGPYLVLYKYSQGQFLSGQSLNSKNVGVTNVKFYVSPACNFNTQGAGAAPPIESTVSIPNYAIGQSACD